MTHEDVVAAALAPFLKSDKRRAQAAEAVTAALGDQGMLVEFEVETVEVPGARVPIERVDAYGLEIAVDGNGNAAAVTSPHGFLVTG